MKTVTYSEFMEAKTKANKELKRISNALFSEPNGMSNAVLEEAPTWGQEDKTIRMHINWSACGTVDLSKALAMAALLQKATEMASSFVYNGYIIED